MDHRSKSEVERVRALLACVVRDFMRDWDPSGHNEGRPFELVTDSYVIHGRVSRVTAPSHARRGANGVEGRDAAAIGKAVIGIAHVLRYLIALIRDYADGMVRELDEPHPADAREILEVAEAAAGLLSRVLERATDHPKESAG